MGWTYDYEADLAGLATVLARHQRSGFTFVNIGANDGVVNDPCWPFIARYGWAGVCVEPVPVVFERLVANYAGLPSVQLVQAAITAEPTTFWCIDRPDFATSQIGSVSKERVEHSLFGLGLAPDIVPDVPVDVPSPTALDTDRRAGHLVEIRPECLTFDGLATRCGLDRVDLVNIDVEGADWEVLSMIDLDRYRTSVVIVETAGTDDEAAVREHLAGRGFGCARAFGVFSTVWER